MERQQAQDFRLQSRALSTDYVTFSLKVPPCHHHYHQHQEAAPRKCWSLLCVGTKGATMQKPSVSPPPLSLQPGAQRHKNSASPFPTSRHQMLGLKRTSEPFCQASLCLNQNALVNCGLRHSVHLKLEQGNCFPWDLTHYLFFQYALLIPKTRLPKLWSLTKPSLLLRELGL